MLTLGSQMFLFRNRRLAHARNCCRQAIPFHVYSPSSYRYMGKSYLELPQHFCNSFGHKIYTTDLYLNKLLPKLDRSKT
jgi:hypothetical protein